MKSFQARFLVALAADAVAALLAPWLVPTIAGPGSIIIAVIGVGLMVAVWIAGSIGLIGMFSSEARLVRKIIALPLCPLFALWALGGGNQHKVTIAAVVAALTQIVVCIALYTKTPTKDDDVTRRAS